MKATSLFRTTISGLVLVLFLAGTALAEIPDTFTNLQVFPKNIGKRSLMGAMRDYSTALGVRCTFCHLQRTPGDFDSIDWASDAIEHKKVTRGMVAMVRDINSELLPDAVGNQDGRVWCITCHRGLQNPNTLDQVLLDTMEEDGIEVAIARYRELRDEYYGSGSYDFSPSVLTSLAETLAQGRGNMDGAVKFLDLGIEMNPEDSVTYLMKSQILVFQGDREGALSNAQKALELDPENERARNLLDQLTEK